MGNEAALAMTAPLRISIVTPCFNAQSLIGETIASVVNQKAVQSGRVHLEYLIRDGASTDGTLDVVAGFSSPYIKLISEPDAGMYEALSKGLSYVSGDIVAYINAGDYYHPYAFDVVADIFGSRPVSWLTGYNVIYSGGGAVTSVHLPFRYRRALFECGAYGRILPFVQQESTFWRRDLNQHLNLRELAQLRYAGDSYLWTTFSRRTELHIVQAALGGFRFHSGQLSEDLDAYFAELRGFTSRAGFLDLALAGFDRAMWQAPAAVKKLFNAEGLLRYDHKSSQWR